MCESLLVRDDRRGGAVVLVVGNFGDVVWNF
jgi:hypothetical protein